MGNSGRLRRGQRLLQDYAITREKQRSLIEEARAARQGEQIAQPQVDACAAQRRISIGLAQHHLLVRNIQPRRDIAGAQRIA